MEIISKKATESQMSKIELPKPQDLHELTAYIDNLIDREHNYGTCVYAMSLAAVAAYNLVAHKLKVSGFQASCADLDIIKRLRRYEDGFIILNYSDLLYPHYLGEEHFPSYQTLIRENRVYLRQKAKKFIKSNKGAHPKVIEHWKKIASKKTYGE